LVVSCAIQLFRKPLLGLAPNTLFGGLGAKPLPNCAIFGTFKVRKNVYFVKSTVT